MILLAIDPGLANTALVLFDGKSIVAKWMLTTLPDGPRPAFEKVLERADDMGVRLTAVLDEARPDRIACESYHDLPSWGENKRDVKNRWTTPIVCAKFDSAFRAYGAPVSWQSPTCLAPYKAIRMTWAAGGFGIVPGDKVLTNDHLRAAGAHGLVWLDRNGVKR